MVFKKNRRYKMDSQTRALIGLQKELRNLADAVQQKSQTKALQGIERQLKALVNLQLYSLQDKYLKETDTDLRDRAPHGFDIEKEVKIKYKDFKIFIEKIAYPEKK